MAPAKAGRGRDAQMAAGLEPTRTDAGFGIGQVGQEALAIFQKRAAFVRERDAPGGAYQQFHAQVGFQRIQAPPHDGRGYAFGYCRCGQAAACGDGDKGFELFELAHAARLQP